MLHCLLQRKQFCAHLDNEKSTPRNQIIQFIDPVTFAAIANRAHSREFHSTSRNLSHQR